MFFARLRDPRLKLGIPGSNSQANAKAKCGGPSTAAAKAPPSVGMTGFGGWKRTSNGKDTLRTVYVPTLCGETAKDGAPELLRWVGECGSLAQMPTHRIRQRRDEWGTRFSGWLR